MSVAMLWYLLPPPTALLKQRFDALNPFLQAPVVAVPTASSQEGIVLPPVDAHAFGGIDGADEERELLTDLGCQLRHGAVDLSPGAPPGRTHSSAQRFMATTSTDTTAVP